MKEKLKQLKEHKAMGKWFQRDNLIIIILFGILLLVIALPTKSSNEGEVGGSGTSISGITGSSHTSLDRGQNGSSAQKGDDGAGGNTSVEGQASLAEYEEALEKRLEEILEGMAGAGKVEVMITFVSSQELVVEKDRPMTRSNTTESDGEGGTRTIYQTDSGETTVYRGEGSDSEPYVVKTLTPEVEGVLVAAQGAGTGEVTKNITEAIQALFDLEAHKIKVIRMKSS